MNEFWLIFGMFVVTFGVRYGSLALVGRVQLSPVLQRALTYVPVAVLTAITVPYVLYREDGLQFGLANPYLVGALVAVVASYTTKNLLLTICIGLAAFFAYRFLLGG